jgi:4-amino-4-deoxy-L-arabinose transferase-like glycosyltransferase
MTKNARYILLLAAVAFAARLAFAAAFHLGEVPRPGSDQYDYTRYAWNLAHGNGYMGPEPGRGVTDTPSAYIPPGTPAFYAAIYLVAGESPATLRIAQCLLDAASVVVLFFLARATIGPRGAWIAATMFAFYPLALFNTRELMTETLYVFLLLSLALICVTRLAPQPGWKPAAAAGVVMGATILTRPTLLFFLPFYVLWAALVFRSWKGRAAAAMVLVVAAAVVLPWTIRVSRLYHRFVLVAPTAWTVMIQGNNRIVATDPKYAGYCIWYSRIPEYAHEFDGLNLVEREDKAKALMLKWLGENRDKWATLVVNKAIRFWTPLLKQDNLLRKAVMLVSWGGVLVLFAPAFLATIGRDLRRGNPRIWLHFFVLATFLQALIYFGLPRYRYPMEPFCIILAALTLDWLARVVRPSRELPEAPAARAEAAAAVPSHAS